MPSLKKQREAIYGVDKPLPVTRGIGPLTEEADLTDLSEDEGQGQASNVRVSSMSDEASRRIALLPENAFERFKVSFLSSGASEALKAKYARLMNIHYDVINSAAHEAARGVPNPSSTPVKGQPHERLVRTSWG